MAYQYNQGFFKPRHPERYKGNPTQIVYRSGLEMKFMMWLDNHPQVTRWASEEGFMIVPYRNPVSGNNNRYFPDFWFEKTVDGKKTHFLVEVKPHAETLPPKPPKDKRGKTRYQRAMATFAINQAKWEAARKKCDQRNWTFKVITERHIK